MTELRPPTFWELARQALSSTRRGYDLLAPKFEATDYATPLELIEDCLSWGDHHFPLSPGANTRGADLACGTGRGARLLRESCEHVVGYDFSAGMLEQAAELSGSLSGLEWRQADLEALELTPASLDRITSFGAWGHILPSFRDRLLKQALQALKPGGLFLTVTANEATISERRFWTSFAFDTAIRIRNLLFPQEFHMYYRLNTTADLGQRLQRLGGANYLLGTTEVPGEPRLSFLMIRRTQNG